MSGDTSSENQSPLTELQGEAIRIAALEEEVSTLLGKDIGETIKVDEPTNTNVTLGAGIDTSMFTNAPGPMRISFFKDEFGFGLNKTLGIDNSFQLSAPSPTLEQVESGEKPDEALYLFDSSGKYAKIRSAEEAPKDKKVIWEDRISSQYWQEEMNLGDFELAGMAIAVIRDRLQSYKNQGLI